MNVPFQKKIETYITAQLRVAVDDYLKQFLVFPAWYPIAEADPTLNPFADLNKLTARWKTLSIYPYPYEQFGVVPPAPLVKPTNAKVEDAKSLTSNGQNAASPSNAATKAGAVSATPAAPVDTEMILGALNVLRATERTLQRHQQLASSHRVQLEALLGRYLDQNPKNVDVHTLRAFLTAGQNLHTHPHLHGPGAHQQGVPPVHPRPVAHSMDAGRPATAAHSVPVGTSHINTGSPRTASDVALQSDRRPSNLNLPVNDTIALQSIAHDPMSSGDHRASLSSTSAPRRIAPPPPPHAPLPGQPHAPNSARAAPALPAIYGAGHRASASGPVPVEALALARGNKGMSQSSSPDTGSPFLSRDHVAIGTPPIVIASLHSSTPVPGAPTSSSVASASSGTGGR